MNTQEIIELLNLQERQAKQEVIKKFQVDKATVIRVHANDKYDLSNGMVNIQPLDTSKKFSVRDSVFLQIPAGDKQQTKIVARSNIKIPDEELYEYGEEPAEEGTIYLGCPEQNTIKVYSLDGTPGVDMSPGPNSLYNICSMGDYLYCSHNVAYAIFKIKSDGAEYQEIVFVRYYSAHGLAINSAGTHLYTAYDVWGETYGIAKINISNGDVEEIEITEVSFDAIEDLCGDGNYLYVLGHSVSGASRVAVYDFVGNFIQEISTSDRYNKITSDGANLYLNTSSKVDIYTISGDFVKTISPSGISINAVTVKNGKVYIVGSKESGGIA